jgi:hypothetical protein
MSSSSSVSSMKKLYASGVTFVVIRIVLVLLLVFLVYIPKNILAVFENFFFQAFYLLLMAYLALMDAPSGLLMATIFLFAIQQLNQHHKSSPTSVPTLQPAVIVRQSQKSPMMDKKSIGMDNSESEKMMKYDVMQTLENENLVNGVLQRRTVVEQQRNEVDMGKMFDNFDKLEHFEPTGGMDILDPATHPAFKTMTENLEEDSKAFTSKMQFQDAGSNVVPGADPNVGIKAWKDQIGIQGFDLPKGYDKSDYYGSVF